MSIAGYIKQQIKVSSDQSAALGRNIQKRPRSGAEGQGSRKVTSQNTNRKPSYLTLTEPVPNEGQKLGILIPQLPNHSRKTSHDVTIEKPSAFLGRAKTIDGQCNC